MLLFRDIVKFWADIYLFSFMFCMEPSFLAGVRRVSGGRGYKLCNLGVFIL